MPAACTWIPKVRSNDGRVVESKLFKDLSDFAKNRNDTVDLYLRIKSESFIDTLGNRLKFDDNNEPTLRSLLRETDLSDYVEESETLEKLNRRIGHFENNSIRERAWKDTMSNRDELERKAIDFNNSSEYRDKYVATVNTLTGDGAKENTIGIRVERRDHNNSGTAAKMEYNRNLNSKLSAILQNHGISIGVLNDLEERMGINGVTDFDRANQAAEGLIELIRLAKGDRGEQALPEEFAHAALAMLGDNPLVGRLINMVSSERMLREIFGDDYDTYDRIYDGDTRKMAVEASGKLLARHLLNNETIPQKPYKNLLQRIFEAIRNFFRKFDANEIRSAMADANNEFGELAKKILAGEMDSAMHIDKIRETGEFYQKVDDEQKRNKRLRKLLKDIIDNELKRMHIYGRRGHMRAFDRAQYDKIEALKNRLERDEIIAGIADFIGDTLVTIDALYKKIEKLRDSGSSRQDKADSLRDVRNYLESYNALIRDIQDAVADDRRHEDRKFDSAIRGQLASLSGYLGEVYAEYRLTVKPLFLEFIEPYLGKTIEIPFGKNKGKKILAEQLIEAAEKDISLWDRWLCSMADSSDFMLKAFDQVVKRSKNNGRLKAIGYEKRIQHIGMIADKAGIHDFEFMFEKDSKGHKTGNYVSQYNWGEYTKRRDEELDRLHEKYGDDPVGQNALNFNNEMRSWYNANCETIGNKTRPKMSLYGNKEFLNMTASQLEFYNAFMDIKKELDSKLPPYATRLTSAVKIRKDLVERVMESDSVKSGAMQIWEGIKDAFLRRSDDTELGDRATMTDFEGRQVETLPIFYTKMREGESADDLSTDAVSTLIAYAAMACDYEEMDKVIDMLEVGRDIMRERQIGQQSGGKNLKEKFNSLGQTVERRLTKRGDDTKFMGRLNDWFSMVVYSRYMKDEGNIPGTPLDWGKTANMLNFASSINTIAMSLLTGISNIETGKVMMRIESFCKEFYSESDTLWADKTYGLAMKDYMNDIGARVQTSKLALWMEHFDVLQDYETVIRDKNFNRRTKFGKLCTTDTLFFTQNAGEHWMQTRTSLALAHRTKMRGPDGKICSLWDAMEVEYIDPRDRKLGARLKLKEGYTKADGSEWTEDDDFAFTRKAAGINDKLHGIYNKIDRNALQALGIGRMAMMYRKWIVPALNRRFAELDYNYDLQAWTEGYYRTSFRFLSQMTQDLKAGRFALMTQWNNLTDTERANMIRAITEVGHLLLITAAITCVNWKGSEGKRPWALKMLEYQARRLYTEIGAMVPGPQMLGEGLKIIKSPLACVDTIDRAISITQLLNPNNYEYWGGKDALVQRGAFKGRNKATKALFMSPFVPMGRTFIRNFKDIDSSISWLKQ